MKAFVAVLALLPWAVVALPSQHYGHQPPPHYGGYPEPAYPQHPQPPYGYQPAPAYHQPQYGYEQPKHNCSVEDVSEIAEVCTPSLETNCEQVEIQVKKITDGEYCYEVARTVCTESTETVDNEICTYTYQKKYEDTTGKTVDVTFQKESNVQMVTVCQPGHAHGYQSYGHQYCKEVAQETQYNVPVVTPIDVPVRVGYPEPVKTCVNKPVTIPQITCEVVSEQKCVVQPQIQDATETLEKCTTQLGAPQCQRVELTLPKQRCVELVYGYAHETKKHEEPRYPEPQPPKYPEPQPPRYPEPQTPKYPEPQTPKYPEPQTPKYPEPQTSKYPQTEPPKYAQQHA